MVSPTGEKRTRVPVPPHIASVAGLSWAPDGTAIAFGGRTAEGSFDIYVLKLGGGEPAIRLIVPDGIQPAWSPDGRLIAFTTFRDGNLEVYLADSDGGNLRNLTRNEGYDARPAWLPDGRIAFESDRFGNIEICIVEAAGGQVVNLSNHPGQDKEPAISGDGREIAFVSNRDWNFHVYRMAVDGTGVTRLTAGYVSNREPAWSPDGGSAARFPCGKSQRSTGFARRIPPGPPEIHSRCPCIRGPAMVPVYAEFDAIVTADKVAERGCVLVIVIGADEGHVEMGGVFGPAEPYAESQSWPDRAANPRFFPGNPTRSWSGRPSAHTIRLCGRRALCRPAHRPGRESGKGGLRRGPLPPPATRAACPVLFASNSCSSPLPWQIAGSRPAPL